MAAKSGGRREWSGLLSALAFLAASVLIFTRGWTRGTYQIDGAGVELWVRLALEPWRSSGRVPYWTEDLWAGTPAFALAPSFPVLFLLPIALLIGPEGAIKVGALASQVVAAWGAFFLARSLWPRCLAAQLVSGFFYGLHPLFASHLALFGHEPSGWAMASAPWFLWSLRKLLRGEGPAFLGSTALIAAFALLQQAEHFPALAILALLAFLLEIFRARGAKGPRGVLVRAFLAGLLTLGLTAYWWIPLLLERSHFALTPPYWARYELLQGLASQLARHPSYFLTRSPWFPRPHLERWEIFSSGGFYLGSVALAVSFLGTLLVPGADREGYVAAAMLTGALGVWSSSGLIPLVRAELGGGLGRAPLTVLAAAVGILSGSYLVRLGARRASLILPLLVAMTLPYIAPFGLLFSLAPYLRFPRLYVLAPLGLSLGSGLVVEAVRRWASLRRPSLARHLSLALAMAALAGFLLDVAPYRSFYQLGPMPGAPQAYREAGEFLHSRDRGYRLATPEFTNPATVLALVETGHALSVGWPHPIASREMWALAVEAWGLRGEYALRALGLAGTKYILLAGDEPGGKAVGSFAGVRIYENPRALPLARTYPQVVTVGEADLGTRIAPFLAPRGIGVVRRKREGGPPVPVVAALEGSCRGGLRAEGPAGPSILGEAKRACAIGSWMSHAGLRAGPPLEGPAQVGALLRADSDGLAGIGVLLDRHPGPTLLSLVEVGPGGVEAGREVVRASASGQDELGFYLFPFSPLPSHGKTYLVRLSCPACPHGSGPRPLLSPAPKGPGDLVLGAPEAAGSSLAFYPLYRTPSLPAAAPPRPARVFPLGTARYEVQVSTPSPVLVVVAEAFFPGWEARVDGRPSPVYQADGAFLGVPVEGGEHRIEVSWHPPIGLTLGRGVSLAALLISFSLIFLGRGRRQPWPEGSSGGGRGA